MAKPSVESTLCGEIAEGGATRASGVSAAVWFAALALFVEFCACALLRGGPALWIALLVGALVLGGQPDEPLVATLAALAVFVGAKVLRSR